MNCEDSPYIDKIEIESNFNSMGLFTDFIITFYPNFLDGIETEVVKVPVTCFDDVNDLETLFTKIFDTTKKEYSKQYSDLQLLKRQMNLFQESYGK